MVRNITKIVYVTLIMSLTIMSAPTIAGAKNLIKPLIKNNADEVARLAAQQTLRETNARLANESLANMAHANNVKGKQLSLPSIKSNLNVRQSNPNFVNQNTKTVLAANGFSYPSARTSQIIAANKAATEKTQFISAQNINASDPLARKLKIVQQAQVEAKTTRQLADGRLRFNEIENPANKLGLTRGSSMTTEYNPQTGGVRTWYESRTHADQVNRVHPKTINGQVVDSEHFPPTAKDIAKR